MFQAREPQESLWQSEFLITPRKAKLMRRSWAEVFRNEALPLIEEERFAPMYSPDTGRPNRAVQTVLGVLVLKEMFDLTDMEASGGVGVQSAVASRAAAGDGGGTPCPEDAAQLPCAVDGARRRAVGLLRDDGPDHRSYGTADGEAAPGLDARDEQHRGVDAVGSVLRDGQGVPDSGEP